MFLIINNKNGNITFYNHYIRYNNNLTNIQNFYLY